jgi:AmmeMemoRadiSam system protein A
VTIKVADELRGCIGSIEPRRILVIDVVKNAHAAAFSDPRFPALTKEEFEHLHAHISVLGPCEAIAFTSEEDLLRRLRPGIDGVILEEGASRATYLPSVWETLPDPYEFLTQLKLKAGLPKDYWSAARINGSLRQERFLLPCRGCSPPSITRALRLHRSC